MYAVKVYRSERGWTGGELAERAGIRREEVSRIENGRKEPSAKVLKRLAKALGVSVHDLMLTEARFSGPLVEAATSGKSWLEDVAGSSYLAMTDEQARAAQRRLTAQVIPGIKAQIQVEWNVIAAALEQGADKDLRAELEAAKRTYLQWHMELTRLVKAEQDLQVEQGLQVEE